MRFLSTKGVLSLKLFLLEPEKVKLIIKYKFLMILSYFLITFDKNKIL